MLEIQIITSLQTVNYNAAMRFLCNQLIYDVCFLLISADNQLISCVTCEPKDACPICKPVLNFNKFRIDLNNLTDFSNYQPYSTNFVVMPLTTDTTTDQSNKTHPENSSVQDRSQTGDKNANTTNCRGKWQLERVYHDGAVEIYEMPDNSKITIGRNLAANIIIRSIFCSKEHCSITVNGDTVFVEDQSSNGTFVNNIEIEKHHQHQLYNEDILGLGCCTQDIYPNARNDYYIFMVKRVKNTIVQSGRSNTCPISTKTDLCNLRPFPYELITMATMNIESDEDNIESDAQPQQSQTGATLSRIPVRRSTSISTIDPQPPMTTTATTTVCPKISSSVAQPMSSNQSVSEVFSIPK